MAERLADVSIDADGDEFVFRVRPGDRLKSALAFLLSLPSPAAEKRDMPAAAPAANYHAANGAQPKPSLRRFSVAEDLAIAADYREGLSIPELVKKYGGTQPAIGAALDREGVTRRSGSEAMALVHKKRKAQTPVAPPDGKAAAAPQAAKSRENAAPLSGRSEDLQAKITGAPGNGRNTATRASLGLSDPVYRGKEIERLYLTEKLSPNTIAAQLSARGHPISDTAVLKTLRARKVPIRGKKEAQELSRLERGLPVHRHDVKPAPPPKPKPVEIPVDAKRVVKTVAELTPDPVKHKTGREAVNAQVRIAQKRGVQSRNPLNLTDAERQAAVDAYIAKGGAITVVATPKPETPARARPGVGARGDGRR